MKIIFFGSDDFAVTHLERLLAHGHELLCCVTGPDKPQGRGMKLSVSPVKEIALNEQIPCLQPLSLKDSGIVEALRSYKADIFVVVAYGRLLTQEILDIPKMLCVNVHGSLLPKYRGAAPVNWAILNGDKETGVTIQKMALKLDAGEIISQEKMLIDDDEDAAQLRRRMARAGAELLARVLDKEPLGRFSLSPQDENSVTWAPKLTKEMGKIDWKRTARSIIDQVRGLQPWPGAYTSYNGKMLKVTKVQISTEDRAKFTPGQVVNVSRDGFHVACGAQAVLIKEVQPEAGKVMPAFSFTAGHKLARGSSFLFNLCDIISLMSQLRKDPIVGRWTIIATERARRPAAFVDPQSTDTDQKDCPYCQDIASRGVYESHGVKVLDSRNPILDESKPFERRGHGLYDVCHSYGSHEVVLETPLHTASMADLPTEQIKAVMQTYALRMQEHRKNPFIEYILAYKNYGVAAGSRNIGHSRSQIMAVPVLPMRVKDKISGAEQYFDYHERCLFCDMVSQELKNRERVVVENEHFMVITPFASRFPFETWILPKNHHCDFSDGIVGYEDALAAIMKDILLRFKIGLNDPAYNYMIQSSPVKNPSSFKESYHWHIEVMPRLTRVAGFERGTGFYICPIPPEMAAAFLREVDIHART